MGYDTLMLYTEDTYEVDNQPFFGYKRGRYTKQELKEIDAYCISAGIELVPCIQMLAHLNCMFKWWDSFGKEVVFAGGAWTWKGFIPDNTWWMSENKPHGFEMQDIRLGGLIGRLGSCKERLLSYCNGKIECIPELEEPVLKDDCGCSWARIVTPGVISHLV